MPPVLSRKKGFTPLQMASVTGFTLVEIMAVTAIISMVTAMSVPNLMRMRTSANEATAPVNLKSLHNLMEDFRFVNGAYPGDKNQITAFVNTYYRNHPIISTSNTASGDRGIRTTPLVGTDWKFQGYMYDYRPVMMANLSQAVSYEWIAVPETSQVTGSRIFVIDESGTEQELSSSYQYAMTWYGDCGANPDVTGCISDVPGTTLPSLLDPTDDKPESGAK